MSCALRAAAQRFTEDSTMFTEDSMVSKEESLSREGGIRLSRHDGTTNDFVRVAVV